MVINQTNIPLLLGNAKKNSTYLRVNHQSSEYFWLNELEKKLSVMTDGYLWSKPFDITTVGLSGIIQMPVAKVVEEGHEPAEVLGRFES